MTGSRAIKGSVRSGSASGRSSSGADVAGRLHVLAEPVRLRMLRVLEAEELTVGEVAKVVQLAQSTVSRHLKALAEGGWVARRASGTASLYRLIRDDLEPEARALWATVREQMVGGLDLAEDDRRLASVLAERATDSATFFGRVAGAWDEMRNELFGRGFTASALLGLLGPNWSVADIGCGTGNAAELLAPWVREVVAVDRSEPMLEAASKRLTALDNVRFVRGDLEGLPLETASVDAAVCVLVLHHLANPEIAVGEMARIVRPGGTVLVVDMIEHGREEYRHTMGHEHLGFRPEAFAELMRGLGLEQVRAATLTSAGDAKGPGLFAASGSPPEGLWGREKN